MVQEPKTKAGSRVFNAPAAVVDALKAQRKQQAADRLKVGAGWKDEDWVFAGESGAMQDPNNVTHRFAKVRDAAGVRPLPLHALRHSAASVLIAAGVPAEVGAKMLGHERIATFVDTYADLLQEATQDAADRVDAFLRRQGGGA